MILSLGFSSRGFWVRYFMQSWFPLVPKPQSPGLCHIYLLCPLLVPVGKWWPQCIPEPSPSSTSCNAPSLPPVLLERMQCMYQGTQCTHWLQPFWASSRGGATNYLLGAAMVRHFCSGSIRSFHLDPSVHVLVKKIVVRGWFPFRLTVLISLFYKGLSRIFSSTTVQKLNSFSFTLSYGPDLTSLHDYWKNHSCDTTDLCSKVSLCFLIHCRFFIPFLPSKEQVSFNFVAGVKVHSDFGAQENKICHCFHFSLIYMPWSGGTGCHEYWLFFLWIVVWMSSFKPAFFHLLSLSIGL